MKTILKLLAVLAIFVAEDVLLRPAAMAQSSAPTNDTSGLILWWPLEEGSGATTTDASGNGNTGTLGNSPTWTVGIITNGVSFNGSSSQYASTSGSAGAGGLAAATLCAWIKTAGGFSFGFNDSAGQRFSVEGSGGNVYWCVENGPVSYPSCAFVPDGNWHWFALTYNASLSGLASLTAYIDGMAVALAVGGSPPGATLSSSLGVFSAARSLPNSAYYTMAADDLRLYNRPLSAGEISNQFQWPNGGRYMPSARQLSGAQTYYIDYSAGSDANNGLSAAAPWQKHPYMQGFAGTYTHHSGDQFIFRGGVVWPSGCWPVVFPTGGASGNPDYYGVSNNWFAGPNFTRPIFDGGHVASYLFYLGPGIQYVNFNSLELRAINCTVALGQGLICYMNAGNICVTNCWLHDWTLTNSITVDDAHGGFIGGFNGGYGITNIILDHCEISNLENTNAWSGVCVRMGGQLNYCTIHDNSSAILFAQDVNHCTIYDICYPYMGFDPTYHWNGFYMDGANGNGNPAGVNCFLRNSIFHDVGGGANMAYPNVETYDAYIYNNLFYGVMTGQMAIEVDPYDYGGTGVMHSVYVYNNTVVTYGTNWPAVHFAQRAGLQVSNALIFNNHIIGVGASVSDSSTDLTVNCVPLNNLIHTPAQAATFGYTLANQYAPVGPSSPTVGQGTSAPAWLFGNDITNNIRPAAGWDIGAYQFFVPLSPPSALRIVSGN